MERTTKRTRTDGQATRAEYEHNNSQTAASAGTFAQADASTLANRRMAKASSTYGSGGVAGRAQRRAAYTRHVGALNASFASWVESAPGGPTALSGGAREYLDKLARLEGRYLVERSDVLTFGSGDCGQLAHGVDCDEDMLVARPRVVYSLRAQSVVGIACGGLHTAVHTSNGEVFTWGCSDDGALGRVGEENLPAKVAGLPEAIVGLATGDGQTIAVSDQGNVWGWGCYKDKEGKAFFDAVAPADCKRVQKAPMRVAALSGVVSVACGTSYNACVTSGGRLFTWGIGEIGELGRPAGLLRHPTTGEYQRQTIVSEHLTPKPPLLGAGGTELSGVVSVGCGAYHLLAIAMPSPSAAAPVLYTTGLNNYGQLGHGDTENRDRLARVAACDGVTLVSADGGMHHSLALAADGRVLAFGRADYGQLGLPGAEKASAGAERPHPSEIPAFADGANGVVAISCGSNHNLALNRTGAVFTWGFGDMNALGHGKDRDESVPKKIEWKGIDGGAILAVSGGGQHSGIICRAVDVGAQ